jgi:hypothetical protein
MLQASSALARKNFMFLELVENVLRKISLFLVNKTWIMDKLKKEIRKTGIKRPIFM